MHRHIGRERPLWSLFHTIARMAPERPTQGLQYSSTTLHHTLLDFSSRGTDVHKWQRQHAYLGKDHASGITCKFRLLDRKFPLSRTLDIVLRILLFVVDAKR